MKFHDNSIFREWADKLQKEWEQRKILLKILNIIISNLCNDRLSQLLKYALVLDKAEKMERIAEMESMELTESGKQELERLKREVGEIK